jgi:SSS family solute:Na+ symporter
MALTVAWAPNIATFSSLWQYLQSILAYLVPPVVAIFLVGQFWPRANARGAHLALAVGLLLGVLLFYANEFAKPALGLHFLLVAPLIFVASVVILVLGSLGFGGVAKSGTGDLVWTMAHFEEERRGMAGIAPWKDYRVLAGMLLVVTAGIVIWFR